MTTTVKTCFKCGMTLPLLEFYKHSGMAGGYVNKCKSCTKKDVQDNRKARLEYYRSYDKARGNRQSLADLQRYRAENPKKCAAHSKLHRAVRSGALTKPSECSECGTAGKVVGHHDDYDKPLEVRWLCQGCHIQWHKQNGEGLNAK